MKANRYITAMLIPAFIGTLTINAQSANSRSSKDRTRTTNTRPERGDPGKRQTAYNTSERTTQSAQKATPRQSQSVLVTREIKQNSTRNSTYRDPKHVSVSNNINPRSTYTKPSKTVYTYDKKHNNKASHTNYKKHYYGGKHYHYAYPTRSVKMNYHYDTHHHNYRTLYYPAHMDIYWTRGMYREYARMYPSYTYWHYGYGHRISTISTFETAYNMGEVARVYGRVSSTWYNRNTDDFLLFFGGDYPQQNFTVVIPGKVARRYSWRPEQYFLGKHITTTGLITSFEGKPEMVVKQKGQIMLY